MINVLVVVKSVVVVSGTGHHQQTLIIRTYTINNLSSMNSVT
jgi:hypothetical protein